MRRPPSAKERLRYTKNNARRRGIAWRISDRAALAMFDKPCHICGQQGTGLDRVDSTKSYTKANTATACWPCNRARGGDMSPRDFVLHCEGVLRNFYGDDPACDVALLADAGEPPREHSDFDWYEAI